MKLMRSFNGRLDMNGINIFCFKKKDIFMQWTSLYCVLLRFSFNYLLQHFSLSRINARESGFERED